MWLRRFILLSSIGFSISEPSFAQHALFLLGGFEVPSNSFNYQFHKSNNVLQKGWKEKSDESSYTPSPIPAFNLALNYRFFGNFAIEIGTQINEMDFVAYDSRYIARYATLPDDGDYKTQNVTISQGNFNIYQNYNSVWIGGYYYFKNRYLDFGPYLGGGIYRNSLLGRSRSINAGYENAETTDQLNMTVNFVPAYSAAFAEFGIGGTWTSKRNLTKYMSFGFKYYWAGTVMNTDYQHTLNGITDYTDYGTASGSYISFNLRYGIDLIRKNQVGYTTTRYKHPAPTHHHAWFRTHVSAVPANRSRGQSIGKRVTKSDNTRGW